MDGSTSDSDQEFAALEYVSQLKYTAILEVSLEDA